MQRSTRALTDHAESVSERSRENAYYERYFFFFLGHLKHDDESSHVTKSYEQWQGQWRESELTTLISEVGGGTNVQSNQAHVLQYKS